MERARQSAASASGPRDSIDNATFFQNLPSDLRRAILSDMDDSLISHLPEEMRTEAQTLRQERDTRRRQMLEQRHAFLERMMEEAQVRSGQNGGEGGGGGASMLPPTSWPQLSSQGMRYAVVNLNPHMLDGHVLSGMAGGGSYLRGSVLGSSHHSGGSRGGGADLHSKQMLDQEALTCLLVLLFLDQSKLHNNRLHRIIKNLSQHSPTRAWILASLLAIIKEMGKATPTPTSPLAPSALATSCPLPPPLTSGGSSHVDSSSGPVIVTPHHYPLPHWLDISINAALGSHAKIFQFDMEQGGKGGELGRTGGRVNIHPLASTTISHNILDVLIFLARHFGFSFLPSELLPREKAEEKREEGASSDVVSNFWMILLKLDGAVGRKGKGAMKSFKYSDTKGLLSEQELFSGCIMGQLMSLFTHDIIRDNIALIDKLLRLLSIASSSIPRAGLRCVSKPSGSGGSDAESDSKKSTKSSPAADAVFVEKEEKVRMSIVAPALLSNVIGVLTSGRCSEEGLEEATTLLTNLSKASIPTREQILLMLLEGVRTIGHTLCSQIISLDESVNARLHEQELEKQLTGFQAETGPSKGKQPASTASNSGVLAGVVLPSAVSGEEQHVDHSHDLHLPAMEPLTCKGSQQSFFVRMLKVVCQLRESAQLAITNASKNSTSASTSAPASGSGGTSVGAEGASTSSQPPSTAQPESSGDGPLQPLQPILTTPQGQEASTTMEVGGAQQQSVFLQTLSQQLELEELWLILSKCVEALSHTEDPHAVFVLQPTVEAFFLVHANYKDDGQKGKKKSSHLSTGSRFRRFSSSSHAVDGESNPTSPSPFSPLPSTPGPGDLDADPFAHLPPDTAKFLRFAGKDEFGKCNKFSDTQ